MKVRLGVKLTPRRMKVRLGVKFDSYNNINAFSIQISAENLKKIKLNQNHLLFTSTKSTGEGSGASNSSSEVSSKVFSWSKLEGVNLLFFGG